MYGTLLANISCLTTLETQKFIWHCHKSRSALCLTLNLLQQFQEQENKDDQTFYGQEIKKWTESTIAEIKLLARDKHMLN